MNSNNHPLQKPIILSISYGFHDSSLTLSAGTQILTSLELERLFRTKKMSATHDQMEMAAAFTLRRYGLTAADIDLIVMSAPPEKFWHAKEEIPDLVDTKVQFLDRNLPCLEVRHHYAHAGMYLLSGLDDALISTCDSGGNMEYCEFFRGNGLEIERLTQNNPDLTNTVGYHWFSRFLYGYPHAEGKLMGLSAFAEADMFLQEKVRTDFDLLCKLKYSGNPDFLQDHFPEFAGIANHSPMKAAPLARAVQDTFVRKRLEDLAKFISPEDKNLIILGGSALNLECNSAAFNTFNKNMYIPPNGDDTGLSLGQSAIAIARETGKRPIASIPYMGLSETPQNYAAAKAKLGASVAHTPQDIAKNLSKDQVCLAHIGRPELGPRALGHRSFLMSALKEENKTLLSEEIKKREAYRPVAPLVLEEDMGNYFSSGPKSSPYMLFNYNVLPQWRKELAAITHKDGTARVQTVSAKDDPFLHEILREFKAITGHGVLINTSLNQKDEPLSDSLWQTFGNFQAISAPKFVAVNPDDEPAPMPQIGELSA